MLVPWRVNKACFCSVAAPLKSLLFSDVEITQLTGLFCVKIKTF